MFSSAPSAAEMFLYLARQRYCRYHPVRRYNAHCWLKHFPVDVQQDGETKTAVSHSKFSIFHVWLRSALKKSAPALLCSSDKQAKSGQHSISRLP